MSLLRTRAVVALALVLAVGLAAVAPESFAVPRHKKFEKKEKDRIKNNHIRKEKFLTGADVALSEKEYDTNGNKLKEKFFKPDGSLKSEETNTYDASDRVKTHSTVAGTETSSAEYEYDGPDGGPSLIRTRKNGVEMVTQHITYTGDNPTEVRMVGDPAVVQNMRVAMEYDAKGHLAHSVSSGPPIAGLTAPLKGVRNPLQPRSLVEDSGADVVYSEAFYTFDDTLLMAERAVDGLGAQVYRRVYHYDSANNMDRVEEYNAQDVLVSVTTSVYDSNGNNIETTTRMDAAEIHTQVVSTYDAAGNLLLQTATNLKNNQVISQKKVVYETNP